MGIKVSDIADGEARGYAGIPSTTSAIEEIHTLAFASRTAQKTKDHEWINEWKNGGSK